MKSVSSISTSATEDSGSNAFFGRLRTRIAAAAIWVVVATVIFLRPISQLMIYAADSDLLSYIPLVPFISAYLLHQRRQKLPSVTETSVTAAIFFICLSGAIGFSGLLFRSSLSLNDYLGCAALAYVSLLTAGGFLMLGAKWMAAAAFPLAFLVFMAPLPDLVVDRLEAALVLASADVANMFFVMSGIPLLRDGVVFSLPTITLKVAQECSGIHSSWVLLITSLIASNVFLKSSWRRVLLITLIIPLGIMRNAFRILVIGLLCVHIGPEMIDSIIHRRGGPLFFALSLVPLFGLLLWLAKQERKA